MPNPPRSEPQASKGFVRILGAFLFMGGALIIHFGNGWYVDGLIAARWFGVLIMAFGALMEINPERFRERASRFHQIGDQLAKKSPQR